MLRVASAQPPSLLFMSGRDDGARGRSHRHHGAHEPPRLWRHLVAGRRQERGLSVRLVALHAQGSECSPTPFTSPQALPAPDCCATHSLPVTDTSSTRCAHTSSPSCSIALATTTYCTRRAADCSLPSEAVIRIALLFMFTIASVLFDYVFANLLTLLIVLVFHFFVMRNAPINRSNERKAARV